MKTDIQGKLIAQACGWRDLCADEDDEGKFYGMPPGGIPKNPGFAFLAMRIPDYLNSLDAMHEAEKVLGDCEIKWSEYRDRLNKIVEPHRHVLHATAAQRAEAFLKTLNLWTE